MWWVWPGRTYRCIADICEAWVESDFVEFVLTVLVLKPLKTGFGRDSDTIIP